MSKRLKIDGYGQIELNKVAFRRDGRIEAQCKIDDSIEYLENGMLLAVDYATKTVKYPTGSDEFIALNYTSEHMYDERLAGALKHFKLEKNSFYPRLGYLATGDIFTTNCVSIATASGDYATIDEVIAAGAYGHTNTDGTILVNGTKDGAVVKVVCATTMPDGQAAVKFVAL